MTHGNPLVLGIVALLLFASGCSTLKEPDPDSLGQGNYQPVVSYLSHYIPKQMKAASIPGLSIALVSDQQLVWSEGFGLADVEAKRKSTANTVYRAGSVSKLFNAIAVMQLAEQGKLDIEQPLVRYLPSFTINSRFGSTDTINLGNILSHRSGLPGDLIDGMWSKPQQPFTGVVDRLSKHYVAAPVNRVVAYSNLGISLSGHVVERISGKPYSQYMQQHLLDPLEMTESDFTGRLEHPLASKAYLEGEEVDEMPLRDIPAGGLNTNVIELANLLKTVHAKGLYEGKQIIRAETLETMLEPQNDALQIDVGLGVGLGWFHRDDILDKSVRVVGHDGRTIAHSAMLLTAPDLKIGIVLLANSPGSGDAVENIVRKTMYLLQATQGSGVAQLPDAVSRIPLDADGTELTGHYATEFGFAGISGHGRRYRAEALDATFSLIQQDNGWYAPRLKLFGLIPIRPGPLKSLSVTAISLEEHRLLLGDYKGRQFLLGNRILPVPDNAKWNRRLGTYTLKNKPEIPSFDVKQLEFIRDGEYYLMAMTGADASETIKLPFRPVNDQQAVLEGLGRGKGETVFATEVDGVTYIEYSGLRFEKDNHQ